MERNLEWRCHRCWSVVIRYANSSRAFEMFSYHVDAFVPPASGCGQPDAGWDVSRCNEFSKFLNSHASKGWKLHSCEYRTVNAQAGCGPKSGQWLFCVFESSRVEH